jgi:hypothetical protein
MNMIKKGIPVILLFLILNVTHILLFYGCSGRRIKGPAISFGNVVYNFGTIDEGKDVHHTFSFSNPGSEILIIEDIRSACNCIVSDEYDSEVKPGQKGKIPVVLDTEGLQGKITKTIGVKTNVAGGNPFILTLEGVVRVLVQLQPKTLVLGEVDEGTTKLNGTMMLRNMTGKPMQITEIVPPDSRTILVVKTIEQDSEFSIDLTINSPFNAGYVEKTVVLKTSLPEKPEVAIDYSYFYPPIIDVKPEELLLFPADLQNTEVSRSIYIYSRLHEPLKLGPVSLNDRVVNYILEETKPGRIYQIVLTLNPTSLFSDNENLTVTFQILNAPDKPTFTIPIKDGSKM